jgi:hypothetical protein
MIRRLDADDLRFEATFVLVEILEELELRRRRPHDEDGIDAVECSRDLAEEPVRIVWVFSRLPKSFRVPVEMVLRRKNRLFVRRLRMDVKDARFLVIDPDDGVRWHDLMVPQKRASELTPLDSEALSS